MSTHEYCTHDSVVDVPAIIAWALTRGSFRMVSDYTASMGSANDALAPSSAELQRVMPPIL